MLTVLVRSLRIRGASEQDYDILPGNRSSGGLMKTSGYFILLSNSIPTT